MIIETVLRGARRRLRDAGIEDADIEAELLLRHALGFDRARLFAHLDEPLDAAAAARFEGYLQRRLAHEPSAYITGQREFYGLDFAVTPATLIPRPETETLVEAAIELAHGLPPLPPGEGWGEGALLLIADIASGCGAVAVALARALPEVTVYATDASDAALAVAAANARRHGVADRVFFRQGDLLVPLDGPVDLIAANLPYVKTDDWRALAPEVRDHEPRLAIDGGADGLALLRRLLQQAPAYLRPLGGLCLEFGDGQEAEVLSLARAAFPAASVSVRRDLAGRPRVLALSLP